MTTDVCIRLLTLEHCWRISTGSCLILFWVSTTCLPTWRTGWDHSDSTIMRSWWKVSKRGWAHTQQTSLTKAYKNVFPDMTSASILVVTTFRSSLSMYVFFVYNNIFFLIACFVNSSPEVTFQIALVYWMFPSFLMFFVVQQRNIIWRYNYDKHLLDVGHSSGVIRSTYKQRSLETSKEMPRWRHITFHPQGCLQKEWCNRFGSLVLQYKNISSTVKGCWMYKTVL
jgi:hypothetical protein